MLPQVLNQLCVSASKAQERILSVGIKAPGSVNNTNVLLKSSLVIGDEGFEKYSLDLERMNKKAGVSSTSKLINTREFGFN